MDAHSSNPPTPPVRSTRRNASNPGNSHPDLNGPASTMDPPSTQRPESLPVENLSENQIPDDPELQSQLQDLERELAEGDITQKGYEKRRSRLLNSYFHSGLATVRDSIIAEGQENSSVSPVGLFDDSTGMAQNNTQDSYLAPEPEVYQTTDFSAYIPPSKEFQPGDPPSRRLGEYNQLREYSEYQHALNVGHPPSEERLWGMSRQDTLTDSQAYFQDFTGEQQARPGQDSQEDIPLDVMLPLEPREIPFSVQDPHDSARAMSVFDSIGAVLRYRGRKNAREPAFTVLDVKGKEAASLTWEKTWSRAEKVAQVMRDKSNLYRGDRVALVYREGEMADFAVALLGCFLAGVVGVPVRETDDYAQLTGILASTQAHLALTTETTLKSFARDISARRLKWPAGVEWWKTNEFGGYHPKGGFPSFGGEEIAGDNVLNATAGPGGPAAGTTDLAYIDFARAPTGDVRGVVLSHRTIMHQMAVLQATVSTVPAPSETAVGPDGIPTEAVARQSTGCSSVAEVIASYLDPRGGIGMVLSVLFAVYGGHHSVWLPPATVDTPGLYAHVISKFRASLVVADYAGLKRTVYNYQQDPMATRGFKKGSEPDFSAIKLCLIDCLSVDAEFDGLLADRWLRPLRSGRARAAVAPMLTLPEHGGMIISMRDWLGGEERMGCVVRAPEPVESESESDSEDTPGGGYHGLLGGGTVIAGKRRRRRTGADLAELLVDRDALTRNQLVIIATGDDAARQAETCKTAAIRVGAFGFPIPDATLALVDPETCELCAPGTIGEVWVDGPSLSGGFWALPRHTDAIFHARPLDPRTGAMLDLEFLRTGLLGFIVEGKLYVLGLYEDRIRQRDDLVIDPVTSLPTQIVPAVPRHRFFFVQHLVLTLIKTLPRIYDCSAFDTEVNGQYLPVIIIETQAASTAPTSAGGPPRQLDVFFLESLAERVMGVLASEHGLRVYCVMTTPPNKLPRVVKNGHRTVGNMLCRREFEAGSLACVHVKFAVEQSVGPVPAGIDPAGIWGRVASTSRAQILYNQGGQFSGADFSAPAVDERTSAPMSQFSNLASLLQWRAARQPDELAFCAVDGRGKEGKPITWRKFDQKVAAVANLMKSKVKPALRPGEAVLLMYTHSIDFVYALYACMLLGVTAIPVGPVDQQRLAEDGPAMVHVVADWKIRLMLVNTAVDTLLKLKPVSQHLKRTAQVVGVGLPVILCSSKPGRSGGTVAAGLKINLAGGSNATGAGSSGPTSLPPSLAAVVWIHWTPDQRRVAVHLDHRSLMATCQVLKDTCRMPAGRPLIGCVRSTSGLGFIHSWLLGVYLASPTYLVSPVDFAQTPSLLLQTFSRYRVRDSYATAHMLDHIVNNIAIPGHGLSGPHLGPVSSSFSLTDLRNLMIILDGRSAASVLPKVTAALSASGLDPSALAPVYAHPLNPVITARSYMGIGPVELLLDRASLRKGLIVLVEPSDPGAASALRIQDSGIVAASTQVCIVNPESTRISRTGEFGEIWVAGPANANGFYRSRDAFDSGRVGATLSPEDLDALADPAHSQFIRTGDLGFLHTINRPIGPNGSLVAMQLLFVLGQIGETFDVHGLHHFPADIEASVEGCHRYIVPGGSAVFQAGGLVVVLVEVSRRNYLAGIVPVIVNTVLNEHQFVVDIVAFVGPGDFPRSRLGEKQRGKILGGWVAGKWLKVIAQFAIVDFSGVPDVTATITGMENGVASDRASGVAGNGGGGILSSAGGLLSSTEMNTPPGLGVPPAVTVFVTDEHGRPGTAASVSSAASTKGELMRDMPEPRERFARLDLNQ